MLGILYAVVTVVAWGSWLAPLQNIHFKNQQVKTFYVAVGNLVLAFFVSLIQGSGRISLEAFWLPFLGGVVWAVSSYCAFTASDQIGLAKAFGIWAPLNIIVSTIWGAILFQEFINISPLNQFLIAVAIILIIAGVLIIIFAKGGDDKQQKKKSLIIGLSGALGAGILWGTYFVPIKFSSVTMWTAAFPLAIGILVGSAVLVLLTGQTLRLEKNRDYFIVCLTGVLWGIGNYGMLLLVNQMGAAKGFTISQLSIIINALIGIYWLKDPRPGTRAAMFTLIGCFLAMFGGILLGNLN
jgi:glucose uptake protein